MFRSVITTMMRSRPNEDRKSTRLNSSHSQISYAVFCLKKKKIRTIPSRYILQLHSSNADRWVSVLQLLLPFSPAYVHGVPRTAEGIACRPSDARLSLA